MTNTPHRASESQEISWLEYIKRTAPTQIQNIDSWLVNMDRVGSGKLYTKAMWFFDFLDELPKFNSVILPTTRITTRPNRGIDESVGVVKDILRERLEIYKLYLMLFTAGNSVREIGNFGNYFMSASLELSDINRYVGEVTSNVSVKVEQGLR